MAAVIDSIGGAIVSGLLGFSEAPVQASVSVYSSLEAAANHYREQSPTLFALYHKVHTVFATLNLALLACEGAVLWTVLEKQFTWFQRGPELFGSLMIVGWGIVALSIMHYADLLFSSNTHEAELNQQIPETERSKQSIQISHAPDEMIQQFCYAARLVVSVAFMTLAYQPPLICALNVASAGYSLYKVSELKWLRFIQDFSITASVGHLADVVNGVTSEYLFPLIPDFRSERDECPMCLEEEGEKVYFCPDKSYHIKCLPQLFVQRFPNLLNGWNFTRHIEASQDAHTGRMRETVTYPSSIPRDNLPVCPDCRRNPTVDHQLYLTVNDRLKGSCTSGLVTLRG